MTMQAATIEANISAPAQWERSNIGAELLD